MCYAGGENINGRLVREGWALDYRKYSTDYLEAEAKAKRRGHLRHFRSDHGGMSCSRAVERRESISIQPERSRASAFIEAPFALVDFGAGFEQAPVQACGGDELAEEAGRR